MSNKDDKQPALEAAAVDSSAQTPVVEDLPTLPDAVAGSSDAVADVATKPKAVRRRATSAKGGVNDRVNAKAKQSRATTSKKPVVDEKPPSATTKATPAAKRARSTPVEASPAIQAGGSGSVEPDADKGKRDKKDKKDKVVRDSFSMPGPEHTQLKALRLKVGKAGRLVSKSEVLRAGLTLLSSQSTEKVVALVDALPKVPRGKRSKKH